MKLEDFDEVMQVHCDVAYRDALDWVLLAAKHLDYDDLLDDIREYRGAIQKRLDSPETQATRGQAAARLKKVLASLEDPATISGSDN
jgi:hypothetical protein